MDQRRDKNLSSDELRSLVALDINRFMVEWTYRIFDTPEIMAAPEEFLEYLCDEYEKNFKPTFTVRKAEVPRKILKEYFDGAITLLGWAERIRGQLTGFRPERNVISTPDLDRQAALLHLFAHHFKPPKKLEPPSN